MATKDLLTIKSGLCTWFSNFIDNFICQGKAEDEAAGDCHYRTGYPIDFFSHRNPCVTIFGPPKKDKMVEEEGGG